MLLILMVYVLSGFFSLLVTDVILHNGSVVNIVLGTFIIQFIIFYFIKDIDYNKIFRKFKIEKEIFFWSLNYLLANSFAMFVMYKFFKIDALGAEFSDVEKISTILTLSIVIPVLEEIFYRGIICNELWKRKSSLIVIILSGLIFSVTHGIARGLIFMLLGSTFYKSYIYLKSKSIYNSIIIHVINNAILSIVIFYSGSIDWLGVNDLAKYDSIFYILGGLSVIMCVYNIYRMYNNLKIIGEKV